LLELRIAGKLETVGGDLVRFQHALVGQVAAAAERQMRPLMQKHENLKADLDSRSAAQDRKAQTRRISQLEQQLQ
jgi:hypothetical protein